MPEVAKTLQATSLTFLGVEDVRREYEGILPALEIQLTPDIFVTVRAGVVKCAEPYLIIG